MNLLLLKNFEQKKIRLRSLVKYSLFSLSFLILLINCSGAKPLLIGKFPPCPEKPNCVSSKSLLTSHKIAPLTYKGTSLDAQDKILTIIDLMPRSEISIKKRDFKLAVKRNALKRSIKVSFKQVSHKLPALDYVIIVKASQADKEEEREMLRGLWQKCLKINL